MYKTTLPLKWIRVPRIFFWLLGFVHGRVLHTAALDPDSETVTSGFLVHLIKMFCSACIVRADHGREALKKLWPDAESAITEIGACKTSLGAAPSSGSTKESGTLARAREAQARDRAKRLAGLAEAKDRLLKCKNLIQDELAQAQNQADATAERLLALIGAYAQGVLRKPVRQRDLPTVPVENMAARILSAAEPGETGRENDWKSIQEYAKEDV